MVDSRPLDYGEVPSAAARLVLILLPAGNEQPADGIPGDAPIIVALPRPGTSSGSREATVADPEFGTCYQAEMSPLTSFLIKCGSDPDDAPETAQDAFRELFEQWKTVDEPKRWLRKVAFPLFLRQPVRNAAPPEENHDKPISSGVSSGFDFSEEEQRFIATIHLLSTTQRAVLALHIEGFQVPDIAEILGMKPDAVRKNLKEARATLMKSLNPNDNTWTGQGSTADGSPAEGPDEEAPAEGPDGEGSAAEGGSGT
jgi:DNA-directed RNA polymerase specialized sigma24 family protein